MIHGCTLSSNDRHFSAGREVYVFGGYWKIVHHDGGGWLYITKDGMMKRVDKDIVLCDEDELDRLERDMYPFE